MAKKKIENFEAEVKTKKVKIKAKKEDKKVDVIVDTDKVDVELHTDVTNKEFKLDSEKLDVNVKKTAEGTKVVVEAKGNLLKKIGNFIANKFIKKFNNNEVSK
jgi:hypothetical protein